MKSELSLRPVLMIHPDHDEAEYLVTRLQAEGIAHRMVIFPHVSEARDFLETVALLGDERFRPCAILVDEKLGEPVVRSFTQWVRTIPLLRPARIATLTGRIPGEAKDKWGADQTVLSAGALESLLGLLSRACGSS